MVSLEERAELRRLLAEATARPWVLYPVSENTSLIMPSAIASENADGRLIAAAVNALPALLDIVAANAPQAGIGLESDGKREQWALEADKLLWETMEGPYSVVCVLLRDIDHLLAERRVQRSWEGAAHEYEEQARFARAQTVLVEAERDSLLAERRQPAGEDMEALNIDSIARRCARGVRGCSTDEQYMELIARISEALRTLSRHPPEEAVRRAVETMRDACLHVIAEQRCERSTAWDDALVSAMNAVRSAVPNLALLSPAQEKGKR